MRTPPSGPDRAGRSLVLVALGLWAGLGGARAEPAAAALRGRALAEEERQQVDVQVRAGSETAAKSTDKPTSAPRRDVSSLGVNGSFSQKESYADDAPAPGGILAPIGGLSFFAGSDAVGDGPCPSLAMDVAHLCSGEALEARACLAFSGAEQLPAVCHIRGPKDGTPAKLSSNSAFVTTLFATRTNLTISGRIVMDKLRIEALHIGIRDAVLEVVHSERSDDPPRDWASLGGAFRTRGDFTISGKSVARISNAVAFAGGGVHAGGMVSVLDQSRLLITGCQVSPSSQKSRRGSQHGGGLVALIGLKVLDRSILEFQNTHALGWGGAAYVSGDTYVGDGSLFACSDVWAGSTGGCLDHGVIDNGVLRVSGGSSFQVNNARAHWAGGAIMVGTVIVESRSTLEVTNTQAMGLQMSTAGAIWALRNVQVLTDSTVKIHHARASVGGGLFTGTRGSIFEFKNVTASSGDAIVVDHGSAIYISNVTALRNSGLTSHGSVRVGRDSRISVSSAVAQREGSAAISAPCLNVYDHSYVEISHVDGDSGISLGLHRDGLRSCSNSSLRLDGTSRLSASSVRARAEAVLQVVGGADEELKLCGMTFDSCKGDLASLVVGQAAIDGMQVTHSPQCDEGEGLAGPRGACSQTLVRHAGEALDVRTLNVSCHGWATGCQVLFDRSARRLDGVANLVLESPEEHSTCGEQADVVDNRRRTCGCDRGWRRMGTPFVSLGEASLDASQCEACPANTHADPVSFECHQCPPLAPWSEGGTDVCHIWPRAKGMFLSMHVPAMAWAITVVLAVLVLRLPLFVLDMSLAPKELDPLVAKEAAAAEQVLVLQMQGFVNKLPVALKRAVFRRVRYRVEGTGCRLIDDDGKKKTTFALKARGWHSAELRGECCDLDHASNSGVLHAVGWLRILAAVAGCALAVAMSLLTLLAVKMGKLDFSHAIASCSSALAGWLVLTGFSLPFLMRWLTSRYQCTPLALAHREYSSMIRPRLASKGLDLERPDHAGISAGVLWDLLQHYKLFVQDRNMHYVVANIIRPLTKARQASFATLWGGGIVGHFVSHAWQTPFADFVEAVRRHAEYYAGSAWRQETYWVCSFCLSQWSADAALSPSISHSTFAKVLRGGIVRDVLVVFDREAQPLRRLWCLFELLLAYRQQLPIVFGTAEGVLGDAACNSADIAFTVADKIEALCVESCGASHAEDRTRILSLVVKDLGSLKRMDNIIKTIMADAIRVVIGHAHARSDDIILKLSGSSAGSSGVSSSGGISIGNSASASTSTSSAHGGLSISTTSCFSSGSGSGNSLGDERIISL